MKHLIQRAAVGLALTGAMLAVPLSAAASAAPSAATVQHNVVVVAPQATCGLNVPAAPDVVQPDGYTWYIWGSYCVQATCLSAGETVGALPIVKEWHCSWNSSRKLWELWIYADATL